MSHMIVRNRESDPSSQQSGPADEDASWYVLDPPKLTFRDLWGDVKALWRREFSSDPIPVRLAFVLLRIIQHLAFRRGYGPARIRAEVPAPRVLDLDTMGRNLEQIPADKRLVWLHAFLGAVNAGARSQALAGPKSVILELSNTCNFNCVGCGMGAKGVDPTRFMSVQDLRRWTKSAASNADRIRINGLGEATLHPQLADCVEALSTLPGSREIITNGSADTWTYECLLEAGFTILISWDASTPGLFQAIRRGSDFASMRRRLPLLAEVARKRNAPEPALLFTLRPENIGEIASTVRLAAEVGIHRLVVNVFKSPMPGDWTGPLRGEIKESFALAEENALDLGVELALPDHLGKETYVSSSSRKSSARSCSFPWTQLVVRWNGDLTPCNMMNPFQFGNLRQRPFTDCWAGSEARAFRDLAHSGIRHPYCEDCYYLEFTRRAVSCASIDG